MGARHPGQPLSTLHVCVHVCVHLPSTKQPVGSGAVGLAELQTGFQGSVSLLGDGR